MKIRLYILLLLIPAVLTAADARIERWNSRTERLAKYRDEASKLPAVDPLHVKLFNDGIKSAEEFLSILGRYSSGSGTVKAESKKYTVEEIEALTSEIANPVITIHYSVELIRSLNNPEIKSAVRDGINRYALSKGLPELKNDRTGDLIAERYILQKYSAEYDKSKQLAYREILGITQYELSRTGYNSNRIDICAIILKAADKVTAASINRETAFNDLFLIPLPEWKEHERNADFINTGTDAAATFAEAQGITVTPEDRKKGIPHLERVTFQPPRSRLIEICSNTEKSPSTGYNNPVYEIPDFKGIITAVDDIDRYRKSVSASVPSGDVSGFISRVKHNNRGIAEKYIKQYENLFRREKMRIAALKSKNNATIIYNEEIFNAAERHFGEIREKLDSYAELSGNYAGAVIAAHKFDPAMYLDHYSAKTGKNLEYLSFIERLTADASAAGGNAGPGINNIYRASSKELFAVMKGLYTPESIPVDIRSTMTKEHIKTHAGINANLRTKGSALISSARKNTDSYNAAYSETVNRLKSEAITSETSIGQDEVDRLVSYAYKCSEAVSSLTYTANALKNYSALYNRITDDIRENRDLEQYLRTINSGSIIPAVSDFSPERIDSEMKLRDMLVREGMESLSGAVSLIQYYNRRGYTLKYNYTSEDIKLIKDKFSIAPETPVASWKMNGKNYRLVDTNSTENLQKMISRKAWHPDKTADSAALKEKFSPGGMINFSISLPEGWKRVAREDDTGAVLSLSLQSPDLLGKIILRAVKYDTDNLQAYSDELNKAENFTPVAKEWGKLAGRDYLVTVSKNRYNNIMESYVIRKDGYMIQLSGIADKKKHPLMNKNLKSIFSTLDI